MSKEIYISSTPHETRLAIVEDEALTEIYYERENEYTLAGSIYNGRVTRVLPGMQSSFVDIGLERDAFLYITDFMEEAPDPEEFDTASTGDRAPRPNGGERHEEGRVSDRGDRGNRGRRGGRDRDRDRGSDRNADRPASPEITARQPGFDRSAGATDAPVPADSNEVSEIGEGAPGADGGRRWRGRRGRRRGRGTPGDAPRDNAAPANPEAEFSPETEPYVEIDGEAIQPPDAPVERVDDGYRSGDRGGRDRNRNGQRRDGQRFDSPRRDQDQRSQRAPRGFAPSRDLYGVDGSESSSTGPIANAYPEAGSEGGPEPLILPGESLSKYRKGGEEPTSPVAGQASPSQATTASQASITLAPPANLYTLAEGWDGGAVLPGETLSRRKPSDSRTESRQDNRNRPQRDFERGARREGRAEYRQTPPAVPAVEEQTPVPTSAPVEEAVQEFVAPVIDHAPEAIAAAAPIEQGADPVTAPEETAHEEIEYEPVDASASHRVEALQISEYRQSGATLEPPTETAAEAAPSVAEPEPAVASAPIAEVAPAAEPAAVAHDVTSIAATGEMFSEPVEVVPDAPAHPAPMEVPEPASPIRHEGAVLSPEAEFSAPTAGGFAPGAGLIAEEVLDEEDFEGTTLHASSIEEMEDLEEETLEGAADLGTMLREMSIDHITRTHPETEEQDELEEDDLEEDDLEEDDDLEEESDEGFQMENRTASDVGESEDDFPEQVARTGTAEDQEFFEEQFGQRSEEPRPEAGEGQAAGTVPQRRDSGREGERKGGRRDGRRDGRRGRSDRPGSGDRERSGHSNGGRARHSMQSTNLPAISDLLKPGQEILVQIAKEPIAKKGARITSHIALPGRFLVFMPTVNHTGVSRKIESDGERRRLKEILLSEKGDATGGFIVRTAAEGASEEELRSDLRFLLNLWADIKARSESSKSPALIYHDLNLIERILRDQVTDNFSAIWVDSEGEYERVLRFLQRFQPSLIRRVKLYTKDTPLFEQFGITEEINKALRSKVWLKSGGSIVINQTEALVAIDINTGKFVGKTARLEDTIVKTNLDAIPEIVRQIRLRDLGGIIIIDFIDMDERKNRNRVMAALEEELKSDRAPSKVLQFNDFGLVAITRKRVKQSLERTLSTTCTVCTGTGMVKSPVTVCNDIYIEMRKMHKNLDRGDVMLRVHPEVVKQLKSSGAKWLQEMEEMAGKTILVKSDPSLHPEQFDIH